MFLFLNYSSADTEKKYYLFKDSFETEIICISKSGTYECFAKGYLQHIPPYYSQGHIFDKEGMYYFVPGVVDSVALTIIEGRNSHNFSYQYSVKLEGDKSIINDLLRFNYDPRNNVSYDDDMKICIENDMGAKTYQRLNKDSIDFGYIVVHGKPQWIYITIGTFVISKKYQLNKENANEFTIFLNKSNDLYKFTDILLANHSFEKKGDILRDLNTGREYKLIVPINTNINSLREIAENN